jgi:hypothetical protein
MIPRAARVKLFEPPETFLKEGKRGRAIVRAAWDDGLARFVHWPTRGNLR